MRAITRRLRSLLLRSIVPLLAHTLGRLPHSAQRGSGHVLGGTLWATNRRYRKRTLSHLEIAFPQETKEWRQEIAKRCFKHAATNAIEALTLLAGGAERLDRRLRVEGWEHVQQAVDKGERILLLTCHTGFWEVLGLGSARHNLPLFAIGRRPDDPFFATIVERLRAAVKAHTIERGSRKGRSLLRQVLKGEGALAMLIDQDTKVDGTWVPFFGHPAFTPTGAAEIAMKHRMRIIPAFAERSASGHHLLTFHPSLTAGEDVQETTELMSAVIEQHIRRCPEQWVWWHRRWRRQPEGAAPVEPPASSA